MRHWARQSPEVVTFPVEGVDDGSMSILGGSGGVTSHAIVQEPVWSHRPLFASVDVGIEVADVPPPRRRSAIIHDEGDNAVLSKATQLPWTDGDISRRFFRFDQARPEGVPFEGAHPGFSCWGQHDISPPSL